VAVVCTMCLSVRCVFQRCASDVGMWEMFAQIGTVVAVVCTTCLSMRCVFQRCASDVGMWEIFAQMSGSFCLHYVSLCAICVSEMRLRCGYGERQVDSGREKYFLACRLGAMEPVTRSLQEQSE
jgi:hypothetical protein